IGEAQFAQASVAYAGRLGQGAAAEQMALRRLDLAARRDDGGGQGGPQAPGDFVVGGLEHIRRAERRQA
ncbi:hypothetical protein LTR94_037050, partial [Friedmanniomyces endolithicus]